MKPLTLFQGENESLATPINDKKQFSKLEETDDGYLVPTPEFCERKKYQVQKGNSFNFCLFITEVDPAEIG